jgi:hypothetical protein
MLHVSAAQGHLQAALDAHNQESGTPDGTQTITIQKIGGKHHTSSNNNDDDVPQDQVHSAVDSSENNVLPEDGPNS